MSLASINSLIPLVGNDKMYKVLLATARLYYENMDGNMSIQYYMMAYASMLALSSGTHDNENDIFEIAIRLGFLYFKSGDKARAVYFYTLAHQKDPSNSSLLLLKNILETSGRSKELFRFIYGYAEFFCGKRQRPYLLYKRIMFFYPAIQLKGVIHTERCRAVFYGRPLDYNYIIRVDSSEVVNDLMFRGYGQFVGKTTGYLKGFTLSEKKFIPSASGITTTVASFGVSNFKYATASHTLLEMMSFHVTYVPLSVSIFHAFTFISPQ
jgi:hypothetical protein